MDSLYKKQYDNFEEFYNIGFNLVNEIKFKTSGMLANDRVNFARQYLIKDIMNGFTDIGTLSDDAVNILQTSSKILKFSIDNLVKNLIIHSDIKYEDYLMIKLIAKKPSKIVKSKTNYDVLLLKDGKKYYKLVIKTTKNRKENFVKSFHIIQAERYEKY